MAIREIIENATGYDELLAGPEIGTLTKNVLLKKGTAYKRGMMLSSTVSDTGVETASQTVKEEMAEYILKDDLDATTAENDTVGTVYVRGRFHREKVIVADGDTVEAHEAELRQRGIYFTSLKS